MTTPALSRAAIDRAAHHRKDEAWLAAARKSGRLLVVDDERRATADDDGLVLLDAAEHEGEAFFLGLADDGTAYFGAVGTPPRKLGARPVTLRDVGAMLSDHDAGLLVALVALSNWHATHVRCPRCGEPTSPVQGGWVRRCDADGTEHFPRTDAAVIVLIHDGGDRRPLGPQPTMAPHPYSTPSRGREPRGAPQPAG